MNGETLFRICFFVVPVEAVGFILVASLMDDFVVFTEISFFFDEILVVGCGMSANSSFTASINGNFPSPQNLPVKSSSGNAQNIAPINFLPLIKIFALCRMLLMLSKPEKYQNAFH